jgi:hypothetical protein
MNNKGQTVVVIYGLMISIVIIILIMSFAPAIKELVDSAMSATVADTIGMDCSATTDNFVKVACIPLDMTNFAFVGTLLFLCGAIITAKIVF